MTFNPFDHLTCWLEPRWLVESPWAVHVPFGMLLVETLKPHVVVEVGTRSGVSYCAFCQAISALEIEATCYATGSWHEDLREHHDARYGQFSRLMPGSSATLRAEIAKGTVDLLHINGSGGASVMEVEFDRWRSAMSPQGVMLLHGIGADRHEPGGSAWGFWEQVRTRYPHFELPHGSGLGLLAVGRAPVTAVRELVSATGDERLQLTNFFGRIGRPLRDTVDRAAERRDLNWARRLIGEQQAIIAARDESVDWLRIELAETRLLLERATLRGDWHHRQLQEIFDSRAWHWLTRYRQLRRRLGGVARAPSSGRVAPVATSAAQAARDAEVTGEIAALLPTAEAPAMPAREALTLLPRVREEEAQAVLDHRYGEPHRRQPDVICLGIIDWQFRYQRPQQLMSQFAAHGHRVFYVSPSTFETGGHRPPTVRLIKDNVFEVHLAALRAPDVYGERFADETAGSLVDSLAELRRTCGISSALTYVMIASWTTVACEARQRWQWPVVYDCMDEWENFQGIQRSIIDAEQELVRECDLLVVSAARLRDKWRSVARPTVLARNGADYEFYAAEYRPNLLLSDVRHPIVGYYGAIADWFDIELVAHAARARPAYTFVLLGGVFDVDVSSLRKLPNVLLLGQQPYATMPRYLYHFDACIIPFKINAITESTDPVKVYEYLSAGKPVVSVDLPELEACREHIYVAADAESFVGALDRAVIEDDPQKVAERRAFAASQTWTRRYEQIREGITAVSRAASIVVVTYNNLALTKLCLESILLNTGHPNYELIVVDNHSSDGTPAYLRYLAGRHPHIRVIANAENRGFACANNQGLAASRGEDLVLLNNDTVVPPNWLTRLVSRLRDPQVGLVGPVTNFVGNEAKIDVPYRTWGEMETFAAERAHRHEGQVADIDMLAMFCVAFRRDTYAQIGPLDEQFGIGMFEDDDYARRAVSHGYQVICAVDVFVHHVGQAAFRALIDRGEYDALFDRNRRRFEGKWRQSWTRHEHGPLVVRPARTQPMAGAAVEKS